MLGLFKSTILIRDEVSSQSLWRRPLALLIPRRPKDGNETMFAHGPLRILAE
jgi:hypothetical protein